MPGHLRLKYLTLTPSISIRAGRATFQLAQRFQWPVPLVQLVLWFLSSAAHQNHLGAYMKDTIQAGVLVILMWLWLNGARSPVFPSPPDVS